MTTIVARTESCGDAARRMVRRPWSGRRLRQLRIAPQTPGPLAGGLFNLIAQAQGVVAVSSDGPLMLLNCYQRSTFVAPQAALCQPANLQSQFKDCFKMGSLIGCGSSESFQPAFQGPDSVAIQPRESRLVVPLS